MRQTRRSPRNLQQSVWCPWRAWNPAKCVGRFGAALTLLFLDLCGCHGGRPAIQSAMSGSLESSRCQLHVHVGLVCNDAVYLESCCMECPRHAHLGTLSQWWHAARMRMQPATLALKLATWCCMVISCNMQASGAAVIAGCCCNGGGLHTHARASVHCTGKSSSALANTYKDASFAL